ncbi:MAG: ArsR/SmtB family transcription factor [Velocimicrobium sp.]
MNSADVVKVFKAFCDERRVEILQQLRGGEKCACKLLEEVNISQATLSHHMKILCDSGIVNGRKDGKWMHYSINKDACMAAKELLDEFVQKEDASMITGDCCVKK